MDSKPAIELNDEEAAALKPFFDATNRHSASYSAGYRQGIADAQRILLQQVMAARGGKEHGDNDDAAKG